MNIPDDIRHMTVEDAMCSLGAKLPRQCEHIKANGEFCGSPALRGRNYCYFHLTHIGRRLRTERAYEKFSAASAAASAADAANVPLEMPPLEDANSVQIALMQVMDAILHNRLDSKRAGLLLYGLQTASSNLRNGADFALPNGTTMAGGYESFEQDYELGDDVPGLKVEEEEAETEEEDEDETEEVSEDEQEGTEKLVEGSGTDAEGGDPTSTADGPTDKECDAGSDKDKEDDLITYCEPMNQFFCSFMGPMALKQNGGVTEHRSQREVASQRIVRKCPSQARSTRPESGEDIAA